MKDSYDWIRLSYIKDFALILGESIAFISAILSLIFKDTNFLSIAIIMGSLTLLFVAIFNKIDKTQVKVVYLKSDEEYNTLKYNGRISKDTVYMIEDL